MNLNSPISSVMKTQLTTVKPGDKLLVVKRIFEKKEFHHHIPVVADGKLKGMISLADFLYAIKGATLDDKEAIYDRLTAFDIMSEHPITMTPDNTIEDVANELAKGEVHAIAISAEGMIKGIISTADVIRHFLTEAQKEKALKQTTI